jgi:hypothetical protein
MSSKLSFERGSLPNIFNHSLLYKFTKLSFHAALLYISWNLLSSLYRFCVADCNAVKLLADSA